MKKFKTMLVAMLLATAVGCSNNNTTGTTTPAPTSATAAGSQVINAKANGYGGELNVEVTVEDGKIADIVLGDNHETNVVIDRAFPVIRERILEANTPAVDSVSAATFSSFAVKQAVASALDEAGVAYEGEVTMAASAFSENPTKVDDVNADVVIIGGGPSGLAAAISIKQANADANVIVCEKLDILSGNGKFDMNYFDMINSKAEEANGNIVTEEDLIADYKDGGESEARLKAWAEDESTMDAWLRDMGVELNFNYGGEGSSSHMAEADQYAGEVVQAGLERTANELGVTILTGTKGVDFVMDGKKVTGAVVTNTKGETYNILAPYTLVATGGFCSNKELLAKYAPGNENLNTSNQMGTTGDLVEVFAGYGMKLERMDKMSVFGNIIVPRRDLTGGADMNLLVNKNGELLNNSLSGIKRWNMEQEQPDHAAFYITDSTGYDSFYRIRKHVALGYYQTGETLEELADKLGIDGETLKQTVADYNTRAENGEVDPVLEKEAKRPLDAEGPYYGVRVEAANHMTKGGIACDEHGQALYEDDSLVEGLFATGEVTSQTGCYSASVSWGRIAGSYIASQLSK